MTSQPIDLVSLRRRIRMARDSRGETASAQMASPSAQTFESTQRPPGSPGGAGESSQPLLMHRQGVDPTRGAYSLEELMAYQGDRFVQNAHAAILKRAPSSAESVRRQKDLEAGMSPVEVVARLRYSPEGRRCNVRVIGLTAPLLEVLASKVPGATYLVAFARLCVMSLRLPRFFDRIRFQAAQQRLCQDELQGQVTALQVRLERREAEFEQISRFLSIQADRQSKRSADWSREIAALKRVVHEVQVSEARLIARLDRMASVAEEVTQSRANLLQQMQDYQRIHQDRLTEITGQLAGHDAEVRWLRGRAESVSSMLASQGPELARLQSALSLAAERVELQARHLRGIEALLKSAAPKSPDLLPAPAAIYSRPWAPVLSAVASRDPDVVASDTPLQETERYYVAFESVFYDTKAVRKNQSIYLDEFAHVTAGGEVLDIGCGRGEFLELLAGSGVGCRGIDINPINVQRIRDHGGQAEIAEACDYLAAAEHKFGGVVMLQVIEHIAPDRIRPLLKLIRERLLPGAPLVIETLNPAALCALESFYMDETHQRPIPPDMLAFLLEWVGFRVDRIVYSVPVAEPFRSAEAKANYFNYAIVAHAPGE